MTLGCFPLSCESIVAVKFGFSPRAAGNSFSVLRASGALFGREENLSSTSVLLYVVYWSAFAARDAVIVAELAL